MIFASLYLDDFFAHSFDIGVVVHFLYTFWPREFVPHAPQHILIEILLKAIECLAPVGAVSNIIK